MISIPTETSLKFVIKVIKVKYTYILILNQRLFLFRFTRRSEKIRLVL